MTLVPAQDPPEKTQNIIAPMFGDRSEIRELVERFRAGLPNAGKLPEMALRALATAAVAHDLDPWNGELWIIYNEDKQETSLMAGIKGLRKGAKRQIADRHYMDPRFEIVPPEDWHKYALEKDTYNRPIERVHLCFLRRSDATERYIEQLDKLVKSTGSYAEARNLIGPPPVYVGIGVVRQGEKSKMERGQLANKRAEADSLKQGFDLPFADRSDAGGMIVGSAPEFDEEEAIEGQVTEVEEKPEDKQEPPQDTRPAAEATKPVEAEKPADAPAPTGQGTETGIQDPKAPEPAQSEIEPEPEPEPPAQPEPPKAAQEKPGKAKPSALPKTKEERDAERSKTIEALRRSSPSTIVTAVEWIRKELGVNLQPGKLSMDLKAKLGKDYELSNPLPPKVWHAAIDMALNTKGA